MELETGEDICAIHSEFCSIFSNPTRIRIYWALQEGEMGVTDLAEHAETSVQNVSQHLRLMKDKGAVVARKEGKQVYYRIANPKFIQAARLIREGIIEELQKKARIFEGHSTPMR